MKLQTLLRLSTFILLSIFISSVTAAEETPAATDPNKTSEQSQEKPKQESSSSATKETTAAEEKAVAETKDSGSGDTDPEPTASKPKQDTNRRIARAQFTTNIVDREPTDDIVMLTNDKNKIYFFTELVNFNGQTVKHRWEYEGKEMAVVNMDVKSARWRAHSSKNIKPEWTGVWSVIVYDQDDRPLKVTSFEVVSANTDNNTTNQEPGESDIKTQ